MKCEGEFFSEPPPDHVARYEWAADVLKGTRGTILDVGCGSGYGVSILEAAGLEALGIERNPDASKFWTNRRCYVGEYPGDFPWTTSAVVMFEVIEHSAEGMKLVEAAMKDAPIVLASVPYMEPPGRNPYHKLFNLSQGSFSWMEPKPKMFRHPIHDHTLLIEWRA